MKEICPFGVKEDCEKCRWGFGHEQCAAFEIATDLSVLAEEAPKIRMLLESIMVNNGDTHGKMRESR